MSARLVRFPLDPVGRGLDRSEQVRLGYARQRLHARHARERQLLKAWQRWERQQVLGRLAELDRSRGIFQQSSIRTAAHPARDVAAAARYFLERGIR